MKLVLALGACILLSCEAYASNTRPGESCANFFQSLISSHYYKVHYQFAIWREDAIQEAYLACVASSSPPASEKEFRELFETKVGTLRKRALRAKMHFASEDFDYLSGNLSGPMEKLLEEQRQLEFFHKFTSALGSSKLTSREYLALVSYFSGENHIETAKKLEVKPGNARRIISKAKAVAFPDEVKSSDTGGEADLGALAGIADVGVLFVALVRDLAPLLLWLLEKFEVGTVRLWSFLIKSLGLDKKFRKHGAPRSFTNPGGNNNRTMKGGR